MSINRVLLILVISLLCLANYSRASTYYINPGDVLRIDIWNEESLSREVLVRPDGMISLPMAGEIATLKKSPPEVASKISSALGKFMKDTPQVVVTLVEATGNKIYVIGKVNKPGEYQLSTDTDVMQALSLAGGLNSFASGNKIVVLRRNEDGSQTSIDFNYSKIVSGKLLESNIILRSRDVVVVP